MRALLSQQACGFRRNRGAHRAPCTRCAPLCSLCSWGKGGARPGARAPTAMPVDTWRACTTAPAANCDCCFKSRNRIAATKDRPLSRGRFVCRFMAGPRRAGLAPDRPLCSHRERSALRLYGRHCGRLRRSKPFRCAFLHGRELLVANVSSSAGYAGPSFGDG